MTFCKKQMKWLTILAELSEKMLILAEIRHTCFEVFKKRLLLSLKKIFFYT